METLSSAGLLEDLALRIGTTDSLDQLRELRVSFLGAKSQIKTMLKNVGLLPDEMRREKAAELNSCRQAIENMLSEAEARITELATSAEIAAEWQDLSLPSWAEDRGARHPLTIIERFFTERLARIGYEYVDGPEIETPFRNFDALNIPEHHPARDVQDTFWLENGLLLRSHTSTVQIMALQERNGKLPIKIVSPGKVYRNEKVDATHLANFHQFEGMCVGEGVTFANLTAVLEYIVRGVFPENMWRMRFKPKFYPYTEPSIGVDICYREPGAKWLTILGAGMVHRNVFRAVGYDENRVTGFAFGIGLSRIASQLTHISDMKSLYDGDLRVHRQLVGTLRGLGR